MTWGMEDPAAEARRRVAIEPAESWTGGGGPPRRRRPRDGLWVVLFVALAAVAIAVSLQRADDASADDPRAAVARGEVAGLSERSLARPANLAAILHRAGGIAGAADRVRSVRVAPASVQLAMVTPQGRQYFIEAGIGGELRRRDFADVPSLPEGRLDAIRPAAIRRAIVTAAGAGGLPVTMLDYVVVSDPGPRQAITVVFDAPGVRDDIWVGTGNGGSMRRANPGAPGAAAAPGGRDVVDEQIRILACVRDAEGDPRAIERCVR